MADTVSRETRSRIMASVSTKHTGPEKTLRSSLHGQGLRFRLHDSRLPGTPDIVFPAARVAVQARGCFWHSHGCPKSRPPTSRQEYWLPKLKDNRQRDARQDRRLRRRGWSVLVVWQCSIRDRRELERQVARIRKAVKRRRWPGIPPTHEQSPVGCSAQTQSHTSFCPLPPPPLTSRP